MKQFVAVTMIVLATTTLSGSKVCAQTPTHVAESGSSAAQITYHLGCKEGNCLDPPWSVDTSSVPEFLHDGRSLDDERQSYSFLERRRYTRALKQFPDADSCVSPDAANEHGVDLTRVNFSKWDSKIKAEVCIARVINRISSIELTVKWLNAIGFKVLQVSEGSGFYEGTLVISPIWMGEGRSPLAWGGFGVFEPLGNSLDIRLRDNDGEVISVSLISNL